MSKRSRYIIILLLVLTAGVILYALFGMDHGVETKPVELPDTQPREAASSPEPSGHDVAELSPETVQAVISRLSRVESYSRTVTIEDFWDGGSSSTELDVWADSSRTRIRINLAGGAKNVLVQDAKLYVWYDTSSAVYENDVMSGSEADEWLRCINYDELLSLPQENILAAGYEQFLGESCIVVEYSSGELGYVNTVYISVSTGLLMGAETYDGETLIYRMSSTKPSLSAPDETMFQLPGSEEEHGAENDQ